MFYSLLGRLVWIVAKRVVRRKYAKTSVRTPLLVAGVVAGVGAAAAVALRRRGM